MISRCFRFFLFLPLLLLVTVPALARQTPEAVLKEIQTAIDAAIWRPLSGASMWTPCSTKVPQP